VEKVAEALAVAAVGEDAVAAVVVAGEEVVVAAAAEEEVAEASYQ
jgi:hypothetical protein